MNDFRLKVFCSVANNMSFTKAARELGITQPAVSKHIQELEQECGVLLLNRLGNGVELTDAGRLLLQHALEIVESYRRLEFDMDILNRRNAGLLRIGTSATIARYILPACLASFSTHFRHINISLIEADSAEIERAVSQGDIDLGLVEFPSHHSSLRYTPFMYDELLLIASSQASCIDRDTITIDELASMPLVVGCENSDYSRLVEQLLATHHLPISALNVVVRMNGDDAVKSFVAHADCCAFVSQQAMGVEYNLSQYRKIAIEGVRMMRQLSFVRQAGVTQPVVKDFIDYMCEWLLRRE